MKASIVDLRYKTAAILKALENKESVTIFYHGKVKGVLNPVQNDSAGKVKDHPFFGMNRETDTTVLEELETLRGPRHVI
jgi:hypothetical protein